MLGPNQDEFSPPQKKMKRCLHVCVLALTRPIIYLSSIHNMMLTQQAAAYQALRRVIIFLLLFNWEVLSPRTWPELKAPSLPDQQGSGCPSSADYRGTLWLNHGQYPDQLHLCLVWLLLRPHQENSAGEGCPAHHRGAAIHGGALMFGAAGKKVDRISRSWQLQKQLLMWTPVEYRWLQSMQWNSISTRSHDLQINDDDNWDTPQSLAENKMAAVFNHLLQFNLNQHGTAISESLCNLVNS